MTLSRRTVGVAATLLALGCGSAEMITVPIGTPPRAPFTTDSIGYLARVVGGTRERGTYEFRIIARYENTSGQPIYFTKCFPNSVLPLYGIGLAKGQSGTAAYSIIWACAPPRDMLIVAPGAVRIDTIVVRGPNLFDGITGAGIGVTEGRFYLDYPAMMNCVTEYTCEAAPESLRVSNEFVIRIGR